MECREHHKSWIPWCKNYEEFVAENINRIDQKKNKFVALLGHHKPHEQFLEKKIKKELKRILWM